ncbi:MAG: hypothetical protein V4692_16435 [Bdellovibrionota bacterium]
MKRLSTCLTLIMLLAGTTASAGNRDNSALITQLCAGVNRDVCEYELPGHLMTAPTSEVAEYICGREPHPDARRGCFQDSQGFRQGQAIERRDNAYKFAKNLCAERIKLDKHNKSKAAKEAVAAARSACANNLRLGPDALPIEVAVEICSANLVSAGATRDCFSYAADKVDSERLEDICKSKRTSDSCALDFKSAMRDAKRAASQRGAISRSDSGSGYYQARQ